MRELLSRVTDFELPNLLEERVDLGRYVSLQVLDAIVKSPADAIGPRRPVADPGRELLVRGDLDEVISGGLGIDLAAVRKVGDQIGILAAVARTRVPVAGTPGDGQPLEGQARSRAGRSAPHR